MLFLDAFWAFLIRTLERPKSHATLIGRLGRSNLQGYAKNTVFGRFKSPKLLLFATFQDAFSVQICQLIACYLDVFSVLIGHPEKANLGLCYLLTYILSCFLIYLLPYLLSYLPSNLLSFLLSYSLSDLLSHILTYLHTYLLSNSLT